MSSPTHQVLRVPASLLEATLGMLTASRALEDQLLERDSPKPLVVHRQTSQITYVAGGRGFAFLEDRVFSIHPGDLLLFEANVPHSFAAWPHNLRLLHWHWPPASVDSDRELLMELCTPLIEAIEGARRV
jgi:mannose-6-phosphate isomerase-like protein (cupin superfamily)